MNGWQEPANGKRIYLITDNTCMEGFMSAIMENDRDRLIVSYSESRLNLGIHYYHNQLYSSNLVGICRLKTMEGDNIYDIDGNELLLKVVPRFNVTVVELLNYLRDDDEFDRYMAPQTTSNRYREKDMEAIDRNEIFYFFENEKPLKVDDRISNENSIIMVTVFLTLLRLLCKKPLMGKMVKSEENLTGKVKGKIVIEKNIRLNTMHGRNDRFYCRYLQFTDDIIENQILKEALNKAKRFIFDYLGDNSKDNNNYTSMISYCSNSLRHISNVKCTGSDCKGLKFTGCYSYYRPVISIAQMVLNDISIESNGEVSTTGYIIPYAISMEKLFEVYVRAYLKNNGIQSYKSNAKSGIVLKKFDDKTEVFVDEEGLSNPGKYISGSIKPDLILDNKDTGETVVIDVKYKDYTNGDSRDDRLQLLAYSMMMNADNVGIILPTQNEEKIFDARRINTMEHRVVKYHQMLLGMKKDNSNIAEYIKEETFNDGKSGL
jgi:5-methylcytosine-specific restriction endonuclease McrBC regulatory subunit McrC